MSAVKHLSDKQLAACIKASQRIIKACNQGFAALKKVRLDDMPMRQIHEHYSNELDGLLAEQAQRDADDANPEGASTVLVHEEVQ